MLNLRRMMLMLKEFSCEEAGKLSYRVEIEIE